MDPNELVRWAEAKASALLSDMGDRWRHVQAVAARAQTAGQALDTEEDRVALLAAAWLHDIGYAPSVAATGFHPLDGARHVRRLGQERVVDDQGIHQGVGQGIRHPNWVSSSLIHLLGSRGRCGCRDACWAGSCCLA
jgi:hypothetical protein